jgi:transposase
VQVVIGLIITPEGFPLGYEVLAGNTADKTTLRDFLKKIETQYGKAERIWMMDRGIPTEEVLAEMRAAEPKVFYLVGTPRGRLTKLETQLLERPWEQVREGVEVKVLAQAEELYVRAKSRERVSKERAMRRRQLKWLWKRLAQLREMKLKRDSLLLKLGAARQQAPRAWRLVEVEVPTNGSKLTYRLRKEALRAVRRREGHYLLRTNLAQREPSKI